MAWFGMNRTPARAQHGDARFLAGIREAQLIESTPRSNLALALMLLTVGAVIVWAVVSRVDQVARATGKVVADGRDQVIASLEGGILHTLKVKEGMVVEAGQELLSLDRTRVASQQNEGEIKRLALLGTQARLIAESSGLPLRFPKDVLAAQEVVAAESEAHVARRRALDEAITVYRRSLDLVNQELAMAQSMAAQGLMSEVEVMRLRRQANDLSLQIAERANRFRQDASTELLRVRAELAQVDEQMVVKQDALTRTVLRSPVRGVVKSIKMGTLGGVVTPGAPIMEIAPIGDRIVVEARVKPADIGFVRIGLPAEVKLSAYDYYTYGGLKGQIESISPDAMTDDVRTPGTDGSYYRALIVADASNLRAAGKPLPVLPGMTATVDIRTGERSVVQYLLRPLFKSREAFRER